jgi:hypothetical protein
MSIKRSCVQVNVMCTWNSKCQPCMTYCNCILNNIMIRAFIYILVSITYSMPIQHMNSWDMWEVVLPLECVIFCCCTVVIFLPRSFIFSKPLLTKKFFIYYGSVKQTWQECSLNGFRSIWKFKMTLEPIIIDKISIFDDKSLI